MSNYVEPVQRRVFAVLQRWVEKHISDFTSSPLLLSRLTSFFDSQNTPNESRDSRTIETTRAIDAIRQSVSRKLASYSDNHHVTMNMSAYDSLPSAPDEPISFTYNSFTPTEFAGQLAWLHRALFVAVDVMRIVKWNVAAEEEGMEGGESEEEKEEGVEAMLAEPVRIREEGKRREKKSVFYDMIVVDECHEYWYHCHEY